jgi:hypothetical protein
MTFSQSTFQKKAQGTLNPKSVQKTQDAEAAAASWAAAAGRQQDAD